MASLPVPPRYRRVPSESPYMLDTFEERCPECGGSGDKEVYGLRGASIRCEKCQGGGWVPCPPSPPEVRP